MPDSFLPYLVEELSQHGVQDYDLDQSGKHNKLIFHWNGRREMHVFSKSPSDGRRGLLNCLSALRNQLGVKRQIRKSEHRERRRRTENRVEKALTLTVKPSPFDVLAVLKMEEKRVCPKLSLAAIVAMLNCEPR